MLAPLLAVALAAPAVGVEVEDPARLLPADTLIYFGSTSVQASFEASKNTAMAKILSEPEVRAFLAQPVAAANQIIRAGLEMASADIAEAQQAAESLGVDMALDPEMTFIDLDGSTPPPVGKAFFALTSIGMPGMNANGSPVPEVGMVIGMQLLAEGVTDSLVSMWGQIPFADANGSHGGVDYLGKASPAGTLCMAVLGDMAVVTTSEASMHGVIDRHAGNVSGGSLAESTEYQLMLNAAGGLIPGGSSHLIRAAPLAGLTRLALSMGLPQSGDVSPEEAQRILELFDSIGFSAIELIGGVSAVGKDGKIYTTSIVEVDDAQKGLISRLSQSAGSIDVSDLGGVPADCLSASAGAMGTTMVDLYDFAMDTLGKFEPGAVDEVNSALSAMMGEYSLRDDVLANVHGRMLQYNVPGMGMMGTPDTVMRVQVNDSSRLVGALDQLLSALSQEAGMPVSLDAQDHEGQPWYKVDLSATPAAMVMQPGFAFEDDDMVFCTSERQLKSVLNRASTGASLWDNPAFKAFASGLDAGGDVMAVSYTDLSKSFGTQYQQFSGMAGMIPGLSQLPMDMAKLPGESAITRHLGESFSGEFRTESGTVVAKSVSQFQVGDFLPLVLVGGAIYAGQELGITLDEVVAEVDPAEQVQNDLRELKASITVFKISQGDYPGSLEDLLTSLADFPNGAYQHDALPVDPWGNAYRYELAMHPKKRKELPKLWSFGPNGVDEGGEGDDILKF